METCIKGSVKEWKYNDIGYAIRHGSGTMTYKNGLTYQGNWENDHFPRCDDSDTSQTIGKLSGLILGGNRPLSMTCGDGTHLVRLSQR